MSFLAGKNDAGVKFFDGKEPWLEGLHKLSWQTFFRVCTEEMDDLSQEATKLVTNYCLEILEEVEEKIRGKSLACSARGHSQRPVRRAMRK